MAYSSRDLSLGNVSTIIPVLAGIVSDEAGKVLITRRKKALKNGGLWEFPGGKLHIDESPEDCLRRELAEELSIQIRIGPLFTLVNHQYPELNILLISYLCKFTGGQIELVDHDRSKWVNLKDLHKYKFSGADQKIIAKLQKVLPEW